jgi:hypothetical protein
MLGLVPGVGDAVGAILAAAILVEALRRGTSRLTLVRIAANIALDAVVGAVPVVGDVFDAVWKANRRNLALLERHVTAPSEAQREDKLVGMLASGLLLVVCLALVFGGVVVAVGLLKGLVMRFQ